MSESKSQPHNGIVIAFPKNNVNPPLSSQRKTQQSMANASNFRLWIAYIKERCPLSSYLLLSIGIAWAPLVLSGLNPEFFGVIWASLLIFSFFVLLRLMDEVKDYHKDIIAHPDRPLPRGLIKLADAKKGVQYGIFLMALLCMFTLFLFGLTPALLFSLTTIYLYLMYREFFAGSWLEQFPLVYATTHQAILFLLCATAASCHSHFSGPESFGSFLEPPLGFFLAAIQIFPAFFAYEIGRKMDPQAHPALKYYRTIYGLTGCRMILVALSLAGLLGLYVGITQSGIVLDTFKSANLNPFIWAGGSLIGILAVILSTVVAGDLRFKWVAHATTLNLIIAIYMPIIQYYV